MHTMLFLQPATMRSLLLAQDHGTVYHLLSASLPHTTPSKKTLNLTFLHCPIYSDIVYFDYVQLCCSSLYCLLRFTNCPTYITFILTESKLLNNHEKIENMR